MMDKKNFFFKIYPLDQSLDKDWFVQVKDDFGNKKKKYGKLRHYSTVKEKKQEAKRIIAAINREENPTQALRHKMDISQWLFNILQEKKPALSKKTFQTYFSLFKKFGLWYHNAKKDGSNVSPQAYIMYLYESGFARNTIRKNAVVLKSYFNVLVSRGAYKVNPFDDVKVKKQRGKSLLPFHPLQIEILKKIIQDHNAQLWDACMFQYYLFYRPGELKQLKISDILFEDMKMIARSEVVKDSDNFTKKIPAPFQSFILKYRSYPPDYFIFSKSGTPGCYPVSDNYFSNLHLQCRKKANLSDRYAFYSWCHTGIKMAAMAGIPIKQLQLQKGHSDLKMFDEYLKNIGVEDCTQLEYNFPQL